MKDDFNDISRQDEFWNNVKPLSSMNSEDVTSEQYEILFNAIDRTFGHSQAVAFVEIISLLKGGTTKELSLALNDLKDNGWDLNKALKLKNNPSYSKKRYSYVSDVEKHDGKSAFLTQHFIYLSAPQKTALRSFLNPY
ncbi:MAG: hypothetical protein COB76_02595 [Alphaproteobacteria bacterium]|nr:MAG: hypothetical protein COB76_02595 [Alphaproteobacteria bacterium]